MKAVLVILGLVQAGAVWAGDPLRGALRVPNPANTVKLTWCHVYHEDSTCRSEELKEGECCKSRRESMKKKNRREIRPDRVSG